MNQYRLIKNNLMHFKALEKIGFTEISHYIRKFEMFERYKELLKIEDGDKSACMEALNKEFPYTLSTTKKYIKQLSKNPVKSYSDY